VAYAVLLAPSAERQLKALDKPLQQRISKRLTRLGDNPRPPGVDKLAGEDNLYRVREGEYRVIYTIQDKELIVLVVKIGHRKEVYRKLSG
jgi:mRNA interferase RelE/StbE